MNSKKAKNSIENKENILPTQFAFCVWNERLFTRTEKLGMFNDFGNGFALKYSSSIFSLKLFWALEKFTKYF